MNGITGKLSARERQVDRLLEQFEEAAVALSWKGNREPECWKDIDEDYARARRELKEFILARSKKV